MLFFTRIVLKLKQCENIARDAVSPEKQKAKKDHEYQKEEGEAEGLHSHE